MIVAEYEAKFIALACFMCSFTLDVERKDKKFEDGREDGIH